VSPTTTWETALADKSPGKGRDLLVPEYVIEVPHSPEECSVADMQATGGDATLCAYRGCGSGTHTTWIVAQLAAENEAWGLVPKLLRDTARVVAVERVPDPAETERGGR
jgi:hypothetical protein